MCLTALQQCLPLKVVQYSRWCKETVKKHEKSGTITSVEDGWFQHCIYLGVEVRVVSVKSEVTSSESCIKWMAKIHSNYNKCWQKSIITLVNAEFQKVECHSSSFGTDRFSQYNWCHSTHKLYLLMRTKTPWSASRLSPPPEKQNPITHYHTICTSVLG